MPKLGTRDDSVACYKYSVSRVAVPRLLSLVLMGAYFFSSYHCTPINRETTENTPWWCQPCQKDHRHRHSRGITDPLGDQFKIAIKSYEETTSKSQYMTHIHTKIGKMSKKQFKNNTWLPRKWYFKTLRKNDEKILPGLLQQIQIYAVTIERLGRMEIRSQDASFDAAERKKTLQLVKDNLNALRCEVKHQIVNNKDLSEKEEVPPNYVDGYIPEAVANLTEGLLKDYSILKDYHNFLKKCYIKIFGKLRKNQKKNNSNKERVKEKKNKKRTPKPKSNKKVSES